jgi:ribosome-binding factor A
MSVRNERLKELIREEAASMILHHLTDPRIGFCTVTRVDLTQDLSACTIHVSVLGEAGVKSRTMHALQDARGLIQSHVGKRMKTRTTPRVSIELDETIEKTFEIEKKIREARATDSDAGKGGEPAPSEPELDEEEENA